MKYLITILFFWSQAAFATNYYVDNSGSDANAGTSAGTAWQTIAKVNSFASFVGGDSILLNTNGTWMEKLIVNTSGVIISSYGIGNKPIITGLKTVTGFTNVGNIWSANVPYSVPSLNTVLIDGKIRAKGRYPNTGYLTLTANVGRGQITGSLTGTPDYTGAECVVRSAHWILDVVKIASQSGGTLAFRDSLTYIPLPFGGTGYFIQNSPLVLDTLGEWAYDSTAKKIYVYATSSPNVQISTIDTLVYVHNQNNVTFNNIQFIGANMSAVFLDTTRFTTIKNCIVNNSGRLGIQGFKAPRSTIQNNSVLNSLSGGIYLREMSGYFGLNQTCDSSLIDNNLIRNTGHLAGMGMSGNGRYMGINIAGHDQVITNNRMDSTGFNGIVWYGRRSQIKYNYVTYSCFIKDDGGAINTGIAPNFDAFYDTGSIVRKNIVVDIIGATDGTNYVQQASGIMFDNQTRGVTADSNTVINPFQAGIIFNDGRYCNLYDNTIISKGRSHGLYIGAAGGFGIWERNIFYNSDSTFYCVYDLTVLPSAKSDYNYFLRPLKQTGILNNRDLPYWTATYYRDSNSVLMPPHTTSALPIIAINPTHSDSTIFLSGFYIDAKGGIHNNSATIPPFCSLILFKSDYDIYKTQFRVGNLIFKQ